MSRNHAVDFDDLLIIVSNLFKDENILKKWRTKYKYIHIDEVRDTSEIEYSILSKLFHNNNVMLCGDWIIFRQSTNGEDQILKR